MRVVVTGATGNVGTSLVDALVRDDAVTSIVGIARRLPAISRRKTQFMRLDVSRDDLIHAFEGADAVVHLAWLIQPARDDRATRRTNIHGSHRVFDAAARAGVRKLVYASSVGVYSPHSRPEPVDESWSTDGVQSSNYSNQKAEVEGMLTDFERKHPEIAVIRLRPCLIFKRDAGSEVKRNFVGPLLPRMLFQQPLLGLLPNVENLRFQVVHSSDVGEAYRLAIHADLRGAFNIAADPVMDSERLARLLHARRFRVSAKWLRRAMDISWRLHLHRTDPGWLDLALNAPLLDTTRARDELGWAPKVSGTRALLELIEGMRLGSGMETPPLAPLANT